MKPKHYLVLDTETASLTGEVYDLGWVVCKKDGVPLRKQSFLISEVLYNPKLMMGAYFASKIFSHYIPLIAAQDIVVKKWEEVADIFRRDMEEYNVQVVCAYNLPFDMRAIKQMVTTYGNQKLLPYRVDLLCLWNACCELRLNSWGYKAFCGIHGGISDAGNFRTSAEWAYRYLTQDATFRESHTALHDAEIEAELLAWCIKRKKKIPLNKLGKQPWRLLKA